MASMLRISASQVLPPSHFPFSASFFSPTSGFFFFLWIAKAFPEPPAQPGFSLQKIPVVIRTVLFKLQPVFN